MSRSQALRAVLFYISVAVFFLGLPAILSFALGYKFDPRTFTFTRGGLMVIKSQPAGAGVSLNGQLLRERTPVTLSELLPGDYKVELSLDGHYPYSGTVAVAAGKVSRLEKVILFPLRQDVEQLNKEQISFFLVDRARSTVYHMDRQNSRLYRSNLDGKQFEFVNEFKPLVPPAKRWELSPDRQSMLYFSAHSLAVLDLRPAKERLPQEYSHVQEFPGDVINEAFWFSDSYHVVIVSNKRAMIVEARPGSEAVTLISLNKRNATGYYDVESDTLYFIDSQKAADGQWYDNLYKLELRKKLDMFGDFLKRRTNEREQKAE